MLANLLQISSTQASAKAPADSGLRIALFLEEESGQWHVRRLAEAMRRRGASVVVTSLPRCAFDTDLASGIEIPGFDGALPDAVFVRSISAGTLEQITFRLGLLHALRTSGVRVWNDARAIERCVDKSMTTFLLHRAGIPTPRTRTVEGDANAHGYVAGAGRRLIFKPLFGSQGKGLLQIDSEADLPEAEAADSIYHLQDFVAPPGEVFEDWRVISTRTQAIAAMARRGKSWVTNVHQGGAPVTCRIEPEMEALAAAALSAVDADYAGIDLIRGHDGRLMVLEVNSNPSWRGLQSVTDIDIADAVVADFFAAIEAHKGVEKCPT
jgi:tetrahydromethanopterin:alpha-L-glutamate ligase